MTFERVVVIRYYSGKKLLFLPKLLLTAYLTNKGSLDAPITTSDYQKAYRYTPLEAERYAGLLRKRMEKDNVRINVSI